MKTRIIFEHAPVKFGNEAEQGALSLHEALCRAIHERDLEAFQWLQAVIVDIALDKKEQSDDAT